MKTIYYIGCFLGFMTSGVNAQNVPGDTDYLNDGYKLVWADEFEKDGRPDPSKWKHEKGFVRNEELQWYQSDNAWCEGGLLIIEGRKESKLNPNYRKGSEDWRSKSELINYTSSSINTGGLHSWKYGRFVMRGKIDVSEGLWPAWWTLGVFGEWPSNGEIDIMEYYRGKILANIAVGSESRYVAKWQSRSESIEALGGMDWVSQFHVWRMDWTEKYISLYVDDQELLKVDMSELNNQDGSGTHPFRQPHYMLLNLALGGNNGGSIQNTKFPNRFQVDYVRVYTEH